MIIGTAGHIDHGKTALVRALTGVDTDRLKEEKARGISIDLGFAYLPTPGGAVLGFVDVPGHERFIHNMLAGATGIDFLLLVVAANDGVKPQTVEHLLIADLLKISRGVVVLTKSDLVDGAQSDKVKVQIRALLEGTTLSSAPIIQISTITGEGMEALRAYIVEAAQEKSSGGKAGSFRLAVDRCFTLPGLGTVVTGTVLSGSVSVGDQVVVSPSGLSAGVRSIHSQNQTAIVGKAGDRCALNLTGSEIRKDSIARGDVVVAPGLHAPTDRIDVVLRVLATEGRPLSQWMPIRLHHAAVEVGARIVLLSDEVLSPGEEGFVQLVLARPIAAASGDRFILRDTSGQRTIGGGRFLDLRAPSRKRRTAGRIAQLRAYSRGEPRASLEALLNTTPFYVDLLAFGRDFALSVSEAKAVAEEVGSVLLSAQDHIWTVLPAVWGDLNKDLLATLEKFHLENSGVPGMNLERLRIQLKLRLPTSALNAFLQILAKRGELALDGAWIRLPSHTLALSSQDEEVWQRIVPLLAGKNRFRPPKVREICEILNLTETYMRRLLKLVSKMAKVKEISRDQFFTIEAISEIAESVHDIAIQNEGRISVAQLRDRLDNGRKIAIEILEFFDRSGVTLRRGDFRIVSSPRLDLFRRSSSGPIGSNSGGEASPVGRPDFKSGRGCETVSGGFDTHSLPPLSTEAR